MKKSLILVFLAEKIVAKRKIDPIEIKIIPKGFLVSLSANRSGLDNMAVEKSK